MGKKTLRAVVVDDDRDFRDRLARAAGGAGIQLDCFASLVDVGSAEGLEAYDLALVDFDVDQQAGVEIAEVLASLFGEVPLVLLSPTLREPTQPRAWPRSVQAIVPKNQDPCALLGRATEALLLASY